MLCGIVLSEAYSYFVFILIFVFKTQCHFVLLRIISNNTGNIPDMEPQNTIMTTDFRFDGQTNVYKGKVRDVYSVDNQLVVVATDRISAFDHVLPRPIPEKGRVLNQLAVFFLNNAKDICPNWLLSSPDPNVSIGLKCDPIKIEMVIRGYMAGHAWRQYAKGERTLCGVQMPEGLSEGDKFPKPLITPATKADEGHDVDISREEILTQDIVSQSIYEKMEDYTRKLFQRGTEIAAERGLILVDTKYEFGLYDGEVYLIDEIHTPDSSRYYMAEGYELRQSNGEKQIQLSKEFVREWLMSNNFQGLEGQKMPEMPDTFVQEVTDKYIHLYELLTGMTFERTPDDVRLLDRIEENINKYLVV